MNITATQRQHCRVCGSSAVRRFLEFPDYPLADNHLESPRSPSEFLCRYRAFWCPECKTAQNLTDLDWPDYYADYDYTVSTSAFARRFMDRLAENAIRQYDLSPGSAVVEIGSSDGHQLACFQKRGMNTFGYEPGRRLADAARRSGVPTTTSLFGADTLHEIPGELRPVQVFLSLYTFDHMADPVACLRAMRQVLDPQRGLVIIEVHDLEQIVARREACLFCHEHTIYPSWMTLGRLMERAGLKLISVDLMPDSERRGNSLLVVGAADTSPIEPALPAQSALLSALDDWGTYEALAAAVDAAHRNLADYVRARLAAGRRIAGYGASARATSTLALAGLTDAEIAYVCDGNPRLNGLYLPKSHVPICPPGRLCKDPVDEVIVFAYGYMDEIKSMLSPLVERGGRLTSLLDLLRDDPDPAISEEVCDAIA